MKCATGTDNLSKKTRCPYCGSIYLRINTRSYCLNRMAIIFSNTGLHTWKNGERFINIKLTDDKIK